MALKLNCLESLTAMGIGAGACALAPFDAGLTAGAVIGGAGLFARIRDNMKRSGLDDAKLIARMQKEILREWDDWQATQEKRDAVTVADAAMTRLLLQVMLTREELAATATQSATDSYPAMAARAIVDRLAQHDTMFLAPPEGGESSPHRRFALEVIERALRVAKEDKDYATLLTLDITIELGRAIAETMEAIGELGAKIDAGFAAVQQSMSGEIERLSMQALRGAVARFVVFRPQASMSEVVEAVERFVPEWEALRARLAALDAADNHLKGAQRAATDALDRGDLDAARGHLAEAAEITVDRASETVRSAAKTIAELARADLLALDWESADANWTRATALIAPFDVELAEAMGEEAADALRSHGKTFGDCGALDAAISRWRMLAEVAAARDDGVATARFRDNLGSALNTRGDRTGGPEGLLLLAQAVLACEAALMIRKLDSMPAEWAMTQCNLGNALRTQGERTGGPEGLALLARTVSAYEAALTVHTRETMPNRWAMTQNNLGNALATQGDRTGGQKGLALLARAESAYEAALTVRTLETMPALWAMTQCNLGSALGTQGERTGGSDGFVLLARAVSAYEAALRVYTREATPTLWAMTQNNRGNSLHSQAEDSEGHEGLALLARAVSAYEAALTVHTREAMPAQWAMTKNNLGNALTTQGERAGGPEGLALLAQAESAYEAALTVRTLEEMPAKWAMTKENLALCYGAMADAGHEPMANLRNAEAAILGALTIYTAEHMPFYHAKATDSLECIREELAVLRG